MFELFQWLCSAVVWLYVWSGCVRLARWVYAWSVPADVTQYQRHGEWAVVTGCTDGIGAALARRLHDRGYNLLLVSRSEEKLLALQGELPRSERLVLDFSQPYDERRVEFALRDKRVGILFNNVGMGYDKLTRFMSVSPTHIHQLVTVNVTNTLLFARTVMRTMSGGLVATVSSGSSLNVAPHMSVYAATKSLLNSWNDSVALECPHLTLQLYTPYYITSKLSHFTQSTMTIPHPEAWVDSALTQVGRGRTTGYPIHDMMCYVLNELMPTEVAKQYLLTTNAL